MKTVLIHLKNKLTIFQKDKTVMFSREEVTDTPAKEDKTQKKPIKPPPLEDIEAEAPHAQTDTEKEDIFELSTPLPLDAEHMKTQPFPKPDGGKKAQKEEEEIFNLGDESRFEEVENIDVPEVIADEWDIDEREAVEKVSIKKEKPEEIKLLKLEKAADDEIEEIGKEYEIKLEEQPGVDVRVPNIPIHIKIPEDKDEIKINLNLQVVIKKKA